MYLPVRISAGLLHVADRVRGHGVWDEWRRLDQSQWWEPGRLAELQAERLSARVREAVATSPLWRERLAKAQVDAASIRVPADLARLPVLERADLQDCHQDLICENLAPGEARMNSTGGSSGTNVKFLVDRQSDRQRDAVDLRLWSFLGLSPGCRAVTVWGSPMDQGGARSLRQRFGRALGNLRFFSAYRLGENDADRILDWLARRRPDVLMGYASVLDLLAERAMRRGG
jgi:phenylacetate-CoA ligase